MSFEDLGDLRIELREHLGKDEEELSDEECDVFLNRGYWALLSAFPFREKEVWMEIVLQSGHRLYSVPTPFEALRGLYVIDPDSKARVPIERTSQRVYETEYNELTTGKPEKYLREGAKIKLVPLPDQNYDGIMHYWTTLAELVNSADLVKAPREWREIVLLEGEWRGWHKQKDIARVKETRALSKDLIDSTVPVESKEEDDSFKAGVEVLGRSFK